MSFLLATGKIKSHHPGTKRRNQNANATQTDWKPRMHSTICCQATERMSGRYGCRLWRALILTISCS